MSNTDHRPRRRRIAFAAPFVLTIAGACGGGQHGGGGGDGCPPGASCNPPPPPDTREPAPPGHGEWKDDGSGGWSAAYPDGGFLHRSADGTCTLITAGSGGCPEGAACNPPPPHEVKCPADEPTTPVEPTAPTTK